LSTAARAGSAAARSFERRLSATGPLRICAQCLAQPPELPPGPLDGLANGLVQPGETNRPVRRPVLRITLVQHYRRIELPLEKLPQIREHSFNDV
jgi:hypothetical protein